jgi:hypothetical protein
MSMHWTLSAEELADIAKVTVESAVLESTIDFWLHRILGIKEKEYRILIGSATIGPKIRMFNEIVAPRLRSRLRIEALKNGVKEMNRLIPERNVVVHGEWNPLGAVSTLEALGSTLDPKQAWGLVAKSAKSTKTVSLSRLPKLAEEIAEANANLHLFCIQTFSDLRQRKKAKKKAAKKHAP